MTARYVYLLGPETVEMREFPAPEPGEGELILRVEAATTCGTDVKVYRRGGHPRMLQVPTPFGHEMAGVVARVGAGVTSFREGDRIVVSNSAPCRRCEYCKVDRENLCRDLEYLNGAFADFVTVPARFVERATYRLADSIDAGVAAVTEPLACVLHGIDACSLAPNSTVLLFGAGPIGLLFVAALAADGHQVVCADPNLSRLAVATQLGASHTLEIERGGGQAERVLEESSVGLGFDCAVDASGVPEVWLDAIAAVRPGGMVNLFGGCAPGTQIPLDTALVHYSELTIKGVYHHRPATVRRALESLTDGSIDVTPILTSEAGLESTESALRSMIEKQNLKVVIRP
ncbi:MAG: alcohol dehydrogenase catalytic domain-containing protein [Planctomycetota bacterium]